MLGPLHSIPVLQHQQPLLIFIVPAFARRFAVRTRPAMALGRVWGGVGPAQFLDVFGCVLGMDPNGMSGNNGNDLVCCLRLFCGPSAGGQSAEKLPICFDVLAFCRNLQQEFWLATLLRTTGSRIRACSLRTSRAMEPGTWAFQLQESLFVGRSSVFRPEEWLTPRLREEVHHMIQVAEVLLVALPEPRNHLQLA